MNTDEIKAFWIDSYAALGTAMDQAAKAADATDAALTFVANAVGAGLEPEPGPVIDAGLAAASTWWAAKAQSSRKTMVSCIRGWISAGKVPRSISELVNSGPNKGKGLRGRKAKATEKAPEAPVEKPAATLEGVKVALTGIRAGLPKIPGGHDQTLLAAFDELLLCFTLVIEDRIHPVDPDDEE